MLRSMAKLSSSAALIFAAASPWFIPPGSALAQSSAAPPSAAFAPEPGPSNTAPAAPTTAQAPAAPAPLPTPPAPLPTPPAPLPPPPAPLPPPPASAPPGYSGAAPNEAGYPGNNVPPPPQKPDQGFQRPEISVRIDPFNFFLEGRLGLEIESQLYQFLSLEIVPVFVTTQSPPTLNYDTYEKATLHQASNGLGALSGTAIDAGFWLRGKPFEGYVLRVGFTNYAYRYETAISGAKVDSVSHTDRQFFAMIGSHSRWGAFTIAGGFGLGYELNRQNRCLQSDAARTPTSSCDKDQLTIKLDNNGNVYNLYGFLYPFDLMARFSLGVVF